MSTSAKKSSSKKRKHEEAAVEAIKDSNEKDAQEAGFVPPPGYKKVDRKVAMNLEGLKDGSNELWLLQLPKQLLLPNLDGVELEFVKGKDENIARFTDKAGNAYTMAMESDKVAEQLYMVAPTATETTPMLPFSKRVTVARQLQEAAAAQEMDDGQDEQLEAEQQDLQPHIQANVEAGTADMKLADEVKASKSSKDKESSKHQDKSDKQKEKKHKHKDKGKNKHEDEGKHKEKSGKKDKNKNKHKHKDK